MRKLSLALTILASVALVAAGALSMILSADQKSRADDCATEDVLSQDECLRIHGEPADVLFFAGLAAAILGLLFLAVVAGRRNHLEVPATAPDHEPSAPRGEAPVRVCPVCSAQSQTFDDSCPHCGSSFIRSRRMRTSRTVSTGTTFARFVCGIAALLIALAIAGVALSLTYASDRDSELASTETAAIEAQEEREAEKAAALEQRQERLERSLRQTLVDELEESITKDAQKESEQSFALIEGPILETQCDPKGGSIDTEATTQSFSCLAINEFTGGGGASGYRYSAEVNYKTFGYRWRLGGGI